MTTFVRIAQWLCLILLALAFVAAVQQGQALLWLIKMQLVGAVAIAIINYIRVATTNESAIRGGNWLIILIGMYLLEWRTEWVSWQIQCNGLIVLAGPLTVLVMMMRQACAPVALIEMLFMDPVAKSSG